MSWSRTRPQSSAQDSIVCLTHSARGVRDALEKRRLQVVNVGCYTPPASGGIDNLQVFSAAELIAIMARFGVWVVELAQGWGVECRPMDKFTRDRARPASAPDRLADLSAQHV